MRAVPTLSSSEDIARVLKTGRRFSAPALRLYARRLPAAQTSGSQSAALVSDNEGERFFGRVAYIAGKKQGNAVWRNRAKRVMRAALNDVNIRSQCHAVLEEYNILLVANKTTASLSSSAVCADLQTLLAKVVR
jgi:ribonuclease P protein component